MTHISGVCPGSRWYTLRERVWTALALASCVVIGAFLVVPRLPGTHKTRSIPTSQPAETNRTSSPSDAPGVAPYPLGRWRLGPRANLDHTVLWLSHILVRHREAEPSVAPLNLGDWKVMQPSRTDPHAALATATRIAREAAAHPERFAELAKRTSEDPFSNRDGGYLGGRVASNLLVWPTLLDALASLGVGEVSRVVQTPFGYHVLRREAPPPAELLAAQRLVIGYADATWLSVVGRGQRPARSREQARRLAQSLYLQAAKDPEGFEALVRRYSEHREAERGGDLGVWSSLEPTMLARETTVLRGMRVGEVSPPVETFVGFAILRRTRVTPRAEVAVRAIRVRYDPTDAPSREQAQKEANRLLGLLEQHPERFAELLKQHEAQAWERWTVGRGPFRVAERVEQVGLGDFVADPIDSDAAWWIVRRIDPAKLPPRPPVTNELPDPIHPDLEYFVRGWQARSVERFVQDMREVGAGLPLLDGQRQGLARLHAALLSRWRTAGPSQDERVEAYRDHLRAVEDVLGPERQRVYEQGLFARVEQRVLGRVL